MDSKRRQTFEVMFRTHSRRVLQYARNRGCLLAEAEDAVGEVFLVCWRRLDDVPHEPLPWLLGVARKVVANQFRSQRRRGSLIARLEQQAEIEPACESDLGNVRAEMLQALAELSERDQEAVLLVLWDDLSISEAAQLLECSATAFKVRFHRARKRLMKGLAGARTQGINGNSMELERS